jgi:hypothetical protein
MTSSTRRSITVAVGAIGGTIVGALLCASASTGAVAAPSPVRAQADGPATVAGLSKVLDAFETGSAAGPGVINGVVVTVLGSQAFPPPGDQVQAAVIQGFVAVGTQMTTQGKAGIAQMRDAIAPLACANPAINAGIDVLAGGLDQVADTGAPIAPFDLTAAEMATLFRSFKAPATAC